MPGRRGALLDPRSREYHWVATAIQAVAEASGQKSRWNKRVYFELSGLEGAASPDGGMSVSDATVLHPLRRAYAGEQLTGSDLSQLRDALVTLTHESLHLCHELQNADGAVQLSAAELALEEGLAENWAQQNVHHVIHAMDLAGKHPTLLTQKPVDAYPALQSATTTLVDGVAGLSGRQHDEVVRRLQAANATERFGVIADLVIEGRYGGTGDRPDLRAQLERTLQEKFAPVLTVERDGSLDADAQQQRGSEIGALAVAELDQVLTAPQPRSPEQQPQAVEQTWEEQILAWQKEQAQHGGIRAELSTDLLRRQDDLVRFSVRVGAEVLPGTPEYEWVSSVVAAVERRTGRTSRWDRRLYEGPSDQSGGKAVANGPLILARKNVLDPVVRAYTAQAPLTPDEIVAARQAAYVTVHEAVHHLSDAGDEEAPDAVLHGSPAEIALEEGLADTEAVRIEMDIIRDIGMDRTVPRILDLRITAAMYPACNRAVDEVVNGLAEITEQHPDDIRAAIHRTPMAQRYAAMADLVIDHRLSDLTEHRAELRARLALPLRSGLEALPRHEVEGRARPAEMTPEQAADIGAQHAQRAVREVARRLPQLRSQYAAVADMQRFLGEHTGHSTAAGAGAGGAAAGAGAAAASGAAAAAAVVVPFRRELGRALE